MERISDIQFQPVAGMVAPPTQPEETHKRKTHKDQSEIYLSQTKQMALMDIHGKHTEYL